MSLGDGGEVNGAAGGGEDVMAFEDGDLEVRDEGGQLFGEGEGTGDAGDASADDEDVPRSKDGGEGAFNLGREIEPFFALLLLRREFAV